MNLTGVTAIAAGDFFTVALKNDGTVVAWGDNRYGQCNVPANLAGVTAIAAGSVHTVALKSDGTVVAWGYNNNGECNVPAGLSGVTAIAAGGYHTVALKGDGTVVVWGASGWGELNIPSGLSGVTAIAAGDAFTVALKGDGTVVAWGDNGYGKCDVPTDPYESAVAGSVSYDPTTLTATFTPSSPLLDPAIYDVTINGVRSQGRVMLAAPVQWSFTTAGNTPAGSNVQVQPAPDTSITFGEVTSEGNTTVTPNPSPPSPPAGYQVLGTAYEVSTTASFSGQVTICFPYDDTGLTPADEASIKILHWEGSPGSWVDVTCSLDTAANKVCGCVSQLSPFAIAVPRAQAVQASLTVKPLPLNLATTQKLFTCRIGLPSGHNSSQIVRSSLRLSVPSCPACGEDASPSGALQGGLYAAKFHRSFLAQAPLGNVTVEVTGQLTDGTPFEGTATIQDWKPLALGDIDLTNAQGQPETQFAKNEPMVFLRCSYEVDPRAGTGKVSALVNAFGHKFRSPWQPVSAGANTLGYTVLVPASAATGPQDVKVTLQLKKAGKVIDTEVRTLHIEVLAQPTDDWQP